MWFAKENPKIIGTSWEIDAGDCYLTPFPNNNKIVKFHPDIKYHVHLNKNATYNYENLSYIVELGTFIFYAHENNCT